MIEKEIKYLELKLQNLIGSRNIYAAVVMALTGYIFMLLPKITIFNIIVVCASSFIDIIFIKLFYNTQISVNMILKLLRSM